MSLKHIAVFAATITIAASALFTSVASATDQKAVLGGGSGIHFGKASNGACTLTAIGYDNNDNLVGLSVGHCVDAAKTTKNDPTFASVTSESAPGAGVIGQVVYHKFSGSSLFNNYNDDANKDYSVIQFDKTKVEPTKTIGRTTIHGIAENNAAKYSVVCKQGRTTGQACGIVTSANQFIIKSPFFAAGGDSGAPVVNTSDGKLVGYVHGSELIPFLTQTLSLGIKPVLSDITSRGGVGAGFTLAQ